jgi:hypothetical protein
VKGARVRPAFRRFAIVVVAILVPVAAHALWDFVETRRLIREVARIRDSGEPVADRDLVERSERTAEEKLAARLYMAAAALALLPQENDKALVADLAKADGDLDRDPAIRHGFTLRLEPVLRTNADAFALLDKATPLAFNGFGPGTEYSYRTQAVWTLAGANELRVAYHCLRNESEMAVDAAIATTRLLRTDPYRAFWHNNVRPGYASVPFILSHCQPSESSLVELQQSLESALIDKTGAAALTRASMRERVLFLQNARRFYWFDTRLPEQYDYRNWPLEQAVLRPMITHRLVGELRDRARLIEAERLPARARAEALRAMPRPAPSARFWGNSFGWGMALGAIDVQVPNILNSHAVTVASITATAVERYRRSHAGNAPPDLAALRPTYLGVVPADPYTDESLLFRQRPDGYVVYSVGSDGNDDQGDVTPGAPQWTSGPPAPPRDRGVLISVPRQR